MKKLLSAITLVAILAFTTLFTGCESTGTTSPQTVPVGATDPGTEVTTSSKARTFIAGVQSDAQPAGQFLTFGALSGYSLTGATDTGTFANLIIKWCDLVTAAITGQTITPEALNGAVPSINADSGKYTVFFGPVQAVVNKIVKGQTGKTAAVLVTLKNFVAGVRAGATAYAQP
jgi:hypothetical protein